MAKLGVFTIFGKSGVGYLFDVYPLHTIWTPISAVYVLTRRDLKPDGTGEHLCISAGQVASMQDIPEETKTRLSSMYRVNCVCILLEDDESKRAAILTDLLEGAALFLRN